MNHSFNLGQRVMERHSGIEGEIIAIELHRYREPRYHIERDGVDAVGNPWPEIWFLEGRLISI